jgi:hypothetical protein
MRMNANRDIGRPAEPDAYWRRRFFMLGGGLFALMLTAWLFSGGSSPSASPTAASRASMAAQESRGGLPSAAYGKVWPGLSPRRTATASAKPSHSAGPSVARTTRRRSGTAAGARCPASDVVLSLFTSQPSYGPAAQPRFDIYAVSTARGWCQLAYGPASIRVIVTRHGQVVWYSTACTSPAAGMAWFERGVPRLLTIAWNRGTTRPAGCAGSLSPGAWGTFEAVAMAYGQTSPVRSFTLTR